jgi:class 3 adenylate cyclase
VSFRRKLQTLLILLVGASCGLLLWMSLRKANHLAFELIQEKVFTLVVSTAPRIKGDKVAGLTHPDQDGSPEYLEVAQKLREVRDANSEGALPIRFVYILRPLPDGTWEYVVDAERSGEDKSMLGDKVDFSSQADMPDLQKAKVNQKIFKDSFGSWLTAYSLIRNSAGETVAYLAADIDAQRVQSLLRRLLFGDLIAMSISLALAAALAAWLSGKVARPLIELQSFVRGIGKGDLASRIKVYSNDEFGELAAAINQMADGLEERESLKGALVHYVRSQAADAKLNEAIDSGEAVSRRITVLVAELCGFGQLSSRLGGERVFALLNEYFSTMIDIVLRHQGSLEKSSDESVIAIFGSRSNDPHQERLAIQAALAMQNALAKLLRDWRVETNIPIFLEIGIHSGFVTVKPSNAGDQLDFESVQKVIEISGRIRKIGRDLNNRLTVSEATAQNLHQTFPMEAVDDDSLEIPLHRVQMPRPSLH